jgi:hypothetical protein
MFDTVNDPAQTFAGLPVEAVAAYGNGKYANYSKAKAQFPNAHILQIDVNGQGIGEAGDFEPGDMQLSSAGTGAKGRIKAGVKRPVIYFSLSNWQPVLDSVKAAGLARSDVRLWTAHYTGNGHLCGVPCGFGGDRMKLTAQVLVDRARIGVARPHTRSASRARSCRNFIS